MGVRGLLTFCNHIKKPARNYPNARIGIDGFSLLFFFREDKTAFEKYLRHMLTLAGDLGSLTFVMDKRAAKEKKEVVEGRKEHRKEAKAEAQSLTSFTQTSEYEELDEKHRDVLERLIALKERAAWHLYPDYLKWLIDLLKQLTIPLIWADEEADTLLARGMYDIIVSSDSDMLILGARRLWIPIWKKTEVSHSEMDGHEFLEFIGLQGNQLFELAFLAGCDVHKSLMSVGEAVSRLRFYGSLEGIHRRQPDIVSKGDLIEYKKLLESVWAV